MIVTGLLTRLVCTVVEHQAHMHRSDERKTQLLSYRLPQVQLTTVHHIVLPWHTTLWRDKVVRVTLAHLEGLPCCVV